MWDLPAFMMDICLYLSNMQINMQLLFAWRPITWQPDASNQL